MNRGRTNNLSANSAQQTALPHVGSGLLAVSVALGLSVLATCTAMATEKPPEPQLVQPSQAQSPQLAASATGLPIPRFASLKVDRVNLRQGPGTDYPIVWVFHRVALPVEILREFEGWRQVRDADGATGWVQASALSGRRTALVSPWDTKSSTQAAQIPLTTSAASGSATVAVVEPGVIVNVLGCDGKACRISIEAFRGYLPQTRLWGVYPNETIN